MAVADQRAGELEQAEVDVGAMLVTGAEPFEGVEPGEGAFDDPPVAAKARAMSGAAVGDARGDTPGAELAAVLAARPKPGDPTTGGEDTTRHKCRC